MTVNDKNAAAPIAAMLKALSFLISAFCMTGAPGAAARPDQCPPAPRYEGAPLRSAVPSDRFPDASIDIGQPVSAALADELAALFVRLVEEQTTARRASIALWAPSVGYWSFDYSVDKAGDGGAGAGPKGSPEAYWWASVGKMATAAVVLQLVRDAELALDDPVSKWFDGYPNAELITIDHLLTHTGGVFSFSNDRKLQRKRGYKSVRTLIDASAKRGADFCPGANWNYSNTGYVMLGRIAEVVTGESLADLVRARLAEPLSLETLAVIEVGDPASSIVAPAGDNPPAVAGIAGIHGAGAIRASAPDMMRLLDAHLRGATTSESLRDLAFSELYPMFGTSMHYGRGVMATDVPDADFPTVWLGHSGGSPNAKGLAVFDVRREAYIAILLNAQAPAEAIANSMLKVLDGAE